ncbi:MAG: alpha/beta fold hydrolase, partial [Parvibaculaceae bacterium]
MRPAIVFLHGITGSATGWTRQIAHFESAHQALAWNAPGYGGRRRADGPLTFEGLAALLASDLDAFGIANAALIGHSFGGMVAQQFVRDFPQRVTHLVLANTSPAFGNPDGEFQKRFIADRLAPLDRGLGMDELALTAI